MPRQLAAVLPVSAGTSLDSDGYQNVAITREGTTIRLADDVPVITVEPIAIALDYDAIPSPKGHGVSLATPFPLRKVLA